MVFGSGLLRRSFARAADVPYIYTSGECSVTAVTSDEDVAAVFVTFARCGDRSGGRPLAWYR